MSEPELLPCPFCGQEAAFNTVKYSKKAAAYHGWDQTEFHGVNCITCGVNNIGIIGHWTQDDAAEAWNTRTAPQAPDTGDKLITINFNEVSCKQAANCGWPECDCPRIVGAHSPEAVNYAFNKARELLIAAGFYETAALLHEHKPVAAPPKPAPDAPRRFIAEDDGSGEEIFPRDRQTPQVCADLIEQCARVAEDQAQAFLSPQYASNQPFGSLCERFACEEVAKAIRALAVPSTDGSCP